MSLNSWKDDIFASYSDAQPVYKEDEVNKRIEYINKFASSWIEADVCEFYDGWQITLTSDEGVVKKVLLEGEDNGEMFQKKVFDVIGNMSKLGKFEFQSRFMNEYSRDEVFELEMPETVKDIIVQNLNNWTAKQFKNIQNVTIYEAPLGLIHTLSPETKTLIVGDEEWEDDDIAMVLKDAKEHCPNMKIINDYINN
jgi:hypothetical protein